MCDKNVTKKPSNHNIVPALHYIFKYLTGNLVDGFAEGKTITVRYKAVRRRLLFQHKQIKFSEFLAMADGGMSESQWQNHFQLVYPL